MDDTARRVEEEPDAVVSIVETFQSLVIAFILAFVFRGFVVEAFEIPTGSMAPTLRGAHVVATGPDSGYRFPVGPRSEESPHSRALPLLGFYRPYRLPDPMLHHEGVHPRFGPQPVHIERARTRMGDRILVLKYLYTLFPPQRYDIVVFKNPTDPRQNYIKRLVGLPGETIWLIDGDIFARQRGEERFSIQRKPEHVQRRAWQPVYHSDYVPINPEVRWSPPWSGRGWETDGRWYRYDGSGPTALTYRADLKPIDDHASYNPEQAHQLPVSDIRIAAGIRAEERGVNSAIRLTARGHEFEAVLRDGRAVLRMRPGPLVNMPAELGWTVLDDQPHAGFSPGRVVNVELWHVDQAMWLWIDDRRIAYGEYDWDGQMRFNTPPGVTQVEWRFDSGPVTLHRIQLDRDLYYRPGAYPSGQPALGTWPNLPKLSDDQFFACGDNSSASADGRTWGLPDPWIARDVDPAEGVVNRDLMIGKAFFVYFPSPEGVREGAFRFVPNFGEMRFIH